MANPSALPPVSPEHRRIATGQFERANQVVATGNYDYGVRLFLSCCKLDPGNLVYRQALRRTEKARYGHNLRGSWFTRWTTWPARAKMKAALSSKDFVRVLAVGETVLARNPWDVGVQMDMAKAAEALGLRDHAVWFLEQARQKSPHDATLNRALAALYEKRGNFKEAMALWQLIKNDCPEDTEAHGKMKNIAAQDTIARGRYEGAVSGGEEGGQRPGQLSPTMSPPESSPLLPAAPALGSPSGSGVKPPPPSSAADSSGENRFTRDAATLRRRVAADPASPNAYLQLAAVHRRASQLDQAREVLTAGLGATGNAFELAAELADLDIEPFRQNLTITEDKLKEKPNDEELRRIRMRLRKEINARELDLFRQKAERFPTELGLRFEVGVRLLRGGQHDEAIQMLQASRSDPRFRWQSMLWLGHCFKARNNWRLAQRNFEEALQAMPTGEMAARKDVLFMLAQGFADEGDLVKAVDMGNELANLDFAYRDIGRLLDEWQNRVRQPRVPR